MKNKLFIAITVCSAGILFAVPPVFSDKKDTIPPTSQGNESQATAEMFNRIDEIVKEADSTSKKKVAVQKYKEAFRCYEKAFEAAPGFEFFLKHHPKMLHCAEKIIQNAPRQNAAFERRIREICRKNFTGKKFTKKVDLKNNQLLFHIGLDHDLKLTLSNGKLLAAKGGGFCGIYSHGGVGTHFDLAKAFPDLFFGYPACWVNDQIWELNNPLQIAPKVREIKGVKLIFCGRKNIAINSNGICSIKWDKKNIWLSDHAPGAERYKILVSFQ